MEEKVKLKDTKTNHISVVNKSVWDNIQKSPVLSIRYQVLEYITPVVEAPEPKSKINIAENKVVETKKTQNDEQPKIIKIVDKTEPAIAEPTTDNKPSEPASENISTDKIETSVGDIKTPAKRGRKPKIEVAKQPNKSGKLLTKKNK